MLTRSNNNTVRCRGLFSVLVSSWWMEKFVEIGHGFVKKARCGGGLVGLGRRSYGVRLVSSNFDDCPVGQVQGSQSSHVRGVRQCRSTIDDSAGNRVRCQETDIRNRNRSRFDWNKLLTQHVIDGKYKRTVKEFRGMLRVGIVPNSHTFIPVLKACAGLRSLEECRRIHAHVIESGYESNAIVQMSLVKMYARCGSLDDSIKLFEKMPVCDVVVWNALISSCGKYGRRQQALELYRQMQDAKVKPTSGTFVAVLNACASLSALDEGRLVHDQIIQGGCESNDRVRVTLIDLYVKCGDVEGAWRVFNKSKVCNVSAWNAMISGYSKSGEMQRALELFEQMRQNRVNPNCVTYLIVVNACARDSGFQEGHRVHQEIIKAGFGSDLFIRSSLIDMYAKNGSIANAWRVFNQLPKPNVVCWNAMLVGFVNCGLGTRALELFKRMQEERVKPECGTYVAVLNACASIMGLEEGRRLHQEIIRTGLDSDAFLTSSLIDMYAKCGSIEDARKVFDNGISGGGVAISNAMLGGYALHGQGQEAVQLFETMCKEGVQLDSTSFVGLLSACSYGGLVQKGLWYFQSMASIYGISPTIQVYTCMVDLLGRSGHLYEAERMINTMPDKHDIAIWRALLGACRMHGNVEMGERVAKRILNLDPANPAGYILLSNIYSAAGRWESRAKVQQLRQARGVNKQIGCTWIEVDNKVHSFTIDDQAHPQVNDIHAELKRLSRQIIDEGYVPNTQFALHDVEEEERVSRMCHHSEKLAIVFGLIRTSPGTHVSVFKNSRVCGDCHTAIKFISNVARRSIFVRDSNRFHKFHNGVCSCGDYW